MRKSAALLCAFVANHASEGGAFEDYLPDGFRYVAIQSVAGDGEWRPTAAHNSESLTKRLVEFSLKKKAPKLDQYRQSAGENWLLIVYNAFDEGHDHFVDENLQNTKFDFAFDKVFLFVRGSAGMGRVLSLLPKQQN